MHKILWAIILAGFGTQLLKMLINYIRHRNFSWHDLVVTGGMPSSHSAFVTSLATIIYLEEGLTTIFVVSFVLAMIIIRDAFGIRRSVGDEGKQIQKLMKLHHLDSKFHYSLGHTPLQVIVGSVLGIVVALLVHLI